MKAKNRMIFSLRNLKYTYWELDCLTSAIENDYTKFGIWIYLMNR